MPASAAAPYKSSSQKARAVTESWGSANLYCANCESPRLEMLRAVLECGGWTPLSQGTDAPVAACHARSSAILRALPNSASFSRESEPAKFVSSDFGKLTRLSHMIHDESFMPSSTSIATCVDNPSPELNTGAQITVEKRESTSACLLTTTNVR